ncbi:hypothetical protein SAMN02983003_3162 [Devosia enhydra]|uniref:Uncharacterized protein n=1 Tax=Devosia enhydra TaxID=665118 RepID=A0A1K2I0T9_9HYPH|nr:hypothetical protein [Devosia enhydra]SFZ85990.1 hypothetical protein SAMN02983003_3162 [Devosia enhydra]
MSRCACCHHPIRIAALKTRAGLFVPPEGMCRQCLRLVGRHYRGELRRSRAALRRNADIAEIVALARAWELVLAEAVSRRGVRRAA